MLLICGVIHTPVLPSPTPATCTWQSQSFAGSIPCHETVTTSLSSNRFGVGSVRQGLKIPSSREKSHPAAMPRAPAPSARRNSRRFMERFMERWLDDPRFLLFMTPPSLPGAKSPHLGIGTMGQKLLGSLLALGRGVWAKRQKEHWYNQPQI